MILLLHENTSQEDQLKFVGKLALAGVIVTPVQWQGRAGFKLSAPRSGLDRAWVESHPEVAQIIPLNSESSAGQADQRATITIGGHTVGGTTWTLMAGPCAVERHSIHQAAQHALECGAHILRGGAYKPRTSPYSFQGLEEEGLKLLAEARQQTGLPFITEALDIESFEKVEAVADGIQIGARSMQNTALLKRCGKSQKPIVLKRGLSATLEEWLLAAAYIREGGNSNIVLCERGIRTFSGHSRFTLDLSVIPVARQFTDLPLIVDPSHATGSPQSVTSMACAAIAAGVDGVMLEMHPSPDNALCDGFQALSPEHLKTLVAKMHRLHAALAPEEVLP